MKYKIRSGAKDASQNKSKGELIGFALIIFCIDLIEKNYFFKHMSMRLVHISARNFQRVQYFAPIRSLMHEQLVEWV